MVRQIFQERETRGEFHKLVNSLRLFDKEYFFRNFRWVQLRLSSVTKSPVLLFLPAIIGFYLNFLFQLQLEKELLVDQDLIFQSKQILN